MAYRIYIYLPLFRFQNKQCMFYNLIYASNVIYWTYTLIIFLNYFKPGIQYSFQVVSWECLSIAEDNMLTDIIVLSTEIINNHFHFHYLQWSVELHLWDCNYHRMWMLCHFLYLRQQINWKLYYYVHVSASPLTDNLMNR